MQKTFDILGKNVQWIVLGIARCSSCVSPTATCCTPPRRRPRSTAIRSMPARPPSKRKKAAKDLDRQIKEARSPSFPTPDLVTAWREHMMEPYATQVAEGGVGQPARRVEHHQREPPGCQPVSPILQCFPSHLLSSCNSPWPDFPA